MTFRKPSRISRSLRLSSSFLTCTNGASRTAILELKFLADPADCAASRVRSLAIFESQCLIKIEHTVQNVPVSRSEDTLDIDSMTTSHVVSILR